MKYVDLHCDTLTALNGASFARFNGHINFEKLKKSGCAAQCFAIFTQGEDAAFLFERHLETFKYILKEFKIRQVLNSSDLISCLEGEEVGAILTVENLGFTGGDPSQILRLAQCGVKMASLVWNIENALAYPNLKCRAASAGGAALIDAVNGRSNAAKDNATKAATNCSTNGAALRGGENPLYYEREARGLKPHGRHTVELLDELKIIVDLSHLSDGGADEILLGRKIPVVASHSDAAAVCGACRNLTDLQIKKIADCGGVIGINFSKNFLGEGETFTCVLRQVKHITGVGGEDAVAFGSDFDGIAAPPELGDCTRMPDLLNYLSDNGICGRVMEKLCYKNFLRVFREVCG